MDLNLGKQVKTTNPIYVTYDGDGLDMNLGKLVVDDGFRTISYWKKRRLIYHIQKNKDGSLMVKNWKYRAHTKNCKPENKFKYVSTNRFEVLESLFDEDDDLMDNSIVSDVDSNSASGSGSDSEVEEYSTKTKIKQKSILQPKMDDQSLGQNLFAISKYLTDGNTVKSHAFDKKSDYINGIDLKVTLERSDEVIDAIQEQIGETDGIINLYRHTIVDLNLLRIALLQAIGLINKGADGFLSFTSDNSKDYSFSQCTFGLTSNESFNAVVTHLKEFCSNNNTPSNLYHITTLYQKLSEKHKIDLLENIVKTTPSNTKMSKRIKDLAYMIDPTINTNDQFKMIVRVVRFLCDTANFSFKAQSKLGVTQFKKDFGKWKAEFKFIKVKKVSKSYENLEIISMKVFQCPSKLDHVMHSDGPESEFKSDSDGEESVVEISTESDNECDGTEGGPDYDEEVDYYADENAAKVDPDLFENTLLQIENPKELKDCLASEDSVIVELKYKERIVQFEITNTQAYLLKKYQKSIAVFELEYYALESIWLILDTYNDFSTDVNINRLLRAKTKTTPGFSKNDLIQERISKLQSLFRDIGLSFTGSAEFSPDKVSDTVEILDFENLYAKIDFQASKMYPRLQKTDRVELWNVVFGNVKSHLSNNRKGSALFHSSYNGSVHDPMRNVFKQTNTFSKNFMELCAAKVRLKVLDNDEFRNHKLFDTVTNVDNLNSLDQKIDLTQFQVKTKEETNCSFILIGGFGVQIEKDWHDYVLEHPIKYVMPNRNNVSTLVDPHSIILTAGYCKLYFIDGQLQLRIPIAEHRVFQAKKDLERYILFI